MPMLDKIFPVLEDKCSSGAALLCLRVVLAWGDAARCCTAGVCQGRENQEVVVFGGIRGLQKSLVRVA